MWLGGCEISRREDVGYDKVECSQNRRELDHQFLEVATGGEQLKVYCPRKKGAEKDTKLLAFIQHVRTRLLERSRG